MKINVWLNQLGFNFTSGPNTFEVWPNGGVRRFYGDTPTHWIKTNYLVPSMIARGQAKAVADAIRYAWKRDTWNVID